MMELKPIGIIRSVYKEKKDAPRQGRLSDQESVIEIFPDYSLALKEIDKVSHLFVLYWGDRSDRSVLHSRTPFSEQPIGVFASRSPNRPNPIAICVVDIIKKEENSLVVRGLDALDDSSVLDIKVYSSGIDCISTAKSWRFPDGDDKISPKRRSNG